MESDAQMLGFEIKTKDEVSATTTKEGFDFQSFHVDRGIQGAPTVATVGDQTAAETFFLLGFLPQQTFGKCPFFPTIRANCIKSRAF